MKEKISSFVTDLKNVPEGKYKMELVEWIYPTGMELVRVFFDGEKQVFEDSLFLPFGHHPKMGEGIKKCSGSWMIDTKNLKDQGIDLLK